MNGNLAKRLPLFLFILSNVLTMISIYFDFSYLVPVYCISGLSMFIITYERLEKIPVAVKLALVTLTLVLSFIVLRKYAIF